MRLFVLIILLLPATLNAQIKVSGIVGGSLSYSNFGKPRAGVPFGLGFYEELNKNIFLSQNIIYRFDGYYFKTDLPPEIKNNDTIRDLGYKSICHQINFLEIPFLFNLRKPGKISPYLGLGASLKFALFSRERISIEYRQFEFRELKLQNSTDLNLLGAIGVQFNFLGHLTNIEARYNHGLSNIINNIKLSSFSLLLIINK